MQRVIDAWPHLLAQTQRSILELVAGSPDAPMNACGTPGSDGEGQGEQKANLRLDKS